MSDDVRAAIERLTELAEANAVAQERERRPCPTVDLRMLVDYMMALTRLRVESDRLHLADEQTIRNLERLLAEQDRALEALRNLLREVALAGVEFDDDRVGYVAVQIDRNVWAEVRALLAPPAPERRP